MPDDYEQSVGKLQSSFSDEQICNILSSSNCKVANNKILNCLIEKLSSKEDLLDLCVQLEKITASHDLLSIMEDIKSSMYRVYVCICTYVIVVTREFELCLMPSGLRPSGIHIRQSLNAKCYS